MIRPRGVVSETVSNPSLNTSLVNSRLLGLYWDAPVLLSSVASNVSITGLRLRALTRASYRASLAYLVCEARRQRLLFEARLR